MELKPISFSGGVKSISDDDLCSDCKNCEYRPGDMSGCKSEWPGLENENGYVRKCQAFDGISSKEENLVGSYWTEPPICCPYCGSKEFVVLDGNTWKATSEEDPANTAELTECQCQGACEGRSFFI
jgi:hypothetical protein